MDRLIEEIIVYWRKALASGYYDSRLNASETSKLISEIERLKKALFEYKNVVDNYSSHLFGCNIDKTDFCTCGLKEAKDRVREALKEK